MGKKELLIDNLVKMAGRKDDSGLTVFDKQKLMHELDKNKNFMRKNKDTFEEGERKFNTCRMYDPCPICEKCRVKGSHLYVKCQSCKIPLCSHQDSDRKKMIVRRNFQRTIESDDFKQAFNNTLNKFNERK